LCLWSSQSDGPRENPVSLPSPPVPIPDPDAGEPEQLAVIFPPPIVTLAIPKYSPVPIPDPYAIEEVPVQPAVIFPLTVVRLVIID
jgi:hypothetical protein